MSTANPGLHTPIYLKRTADMPWPNDKVFYLVTGDGLFLCRNHPFFQSSVAVERFPEELAKQPMFVRLNYPRVPQRLFEKVVGYFARIAVRDGAEAAVLLVWNSSTARVQIVVPEQMSFVGLDNRGDRYPIKVCYQVPRLPEHLMPIGDIHSHVDSPAYASSMDRDDEIHRPGLHIVVGHIFNEPPQFHLELTVDGARFAVGDPNQVLEGYCKRRMNEVPRNWIEKVRVKVWQPRTWLSAHTSKNAYEDRNSAIRQKYGSASSDQSTVDRCQQPSQQGERSESTNDDETQTDTSTGGPDDGQSSEP